MSKVWVKESPPITIPESNSPLGPVSAFPEVTVCGRVSSFVHVSVVDVFTLADVGS